MELYGDLQYAKISKDKAYIVDPDQEPDAIPVRAVGKLPYERIEYIDWDRAPTGGAPRFYVRYGPRRNPCRGINLCLVKDDGSLPLFKGEWKGRGAGPIK